MWKRYTGAAELVTLGLAKQSVPGWNGLFFQASEVSADAQRIAAAIYVTGALVLVFGAPD